MRALRCLLAPLLVLGCVACGTQTPPTGGTAGQPGSEEAPVDPLAPPQNLKRVFGQQGSNREEYAQCNVNLNADTVLGVKVPLTGYQSQVVPAQRAISLAHQKALTVYRLPFTTFWRVTALDLLFPQGPMDCCAACSSNNCADQITFTKKFGAALRAEWEWTSREPEITQSFTNVLPNGTQVSLELPGTLKGDATILAGDVTMWFGSQGTKLPSAKIQDGGSLLFDGEIMCINSLSLWAVMKQTQAGPSIPKLNLFVDPQ